MGRIRWGAPFSLRKKFAKIAKKCDLPLDIYGSICYNNSVRRAVQTKSPGQKEVMIMKTIKLSTKALETLNRNMEYTTRNWTYTSDAWTGEYKRIANDCFGTTAVLTDWETVIVK
jgi:hypothetical protein